MGLFITTLNLQCNPIIYTGGFEFKGGCFFTEPRLKVRLLCRRVRDRPFLAPSPLLLLEDELALLPEISPELLTFHPGIGQFLTK